MSAENALQEAIFDLLQADGPLDALVDSRIFDSSPQDVTFPYVELGESTAADWDSDTHDGQDHTFTIHVWSQKAGRKECKTIQGLIKDALHNTTLTLVDNTNILTRQILSETLKDNDGRTHHGVQQYRIITEED